MLKNLKLLRTKNGVTQQQLAIAVGVSQQSINKYENHDIEPDIATLTAIADYFCTSVDYLIGFVPETEDAHKAVKLSADEAELIYRFRMLSDREKESVCLIIENYLK